MDARKLNNFFLYLYVISIVFEYYVFGGLNGVFSIALLSAVFYILSTLPFIPSRLRIYKFRGTFQILLIFLFFYTFSSFVNQDLLVRLNLVGVEHYFSFPLIDRKSTRLNSSHVKISYAVFCLKKKKHKVFYSYI